MAEWDNELKSAIIAVKKAGRLITERFEKTLPIIRKSPYEFVTKLDLESQSIIVDSLKIDFPDYNLYVEESRNPQVIKGLTWVIDPIDGTHNYIAGLENVGISVALVSEDEFHIGVLHFPMKALILYAICGQGAYCNRTPIQVSRNTDLSKSMVTYDNQFHLTPKTWTNFEKIVSTAFTTRIFGVASWDMALIAMGKIDARIWNCTKLVDVAAGAVILKEAGGLTTDFQSSPLSFNPTELIASNGFVHNDLVTLLDS
jgi:myo-inositol-1(or 4)-monophosphatase